MYATEVYKYDILYRSRGRTIFMEYESGTRHTRRRSYVPFSCVRCDTIIICTRVARSERIRAYSVRPFFFNRFFSPLIRNFTYLREDEKHRRSICIGGKMYKISRQEICENFSSFTKLIGERSFAPPPSAIYKNRISLWNRLCLRFITTAQYVLQLN